MIWSITMSFPAAKSILICLSIFVAARGVESFCLVPQQPNNGRWQLHRSYCRYTHQECDLPSGVTLKVGYQIVYSCKPGYRLRGSRDVHCTAKNDWTAIPTCEQIHCGHSKTFSKTTTCYNRVETDGQSSSHLVKVDCNSTVLPNMYANVTCRPMHRRVPFKPRTNDLPRCREDGEWDSCYPKCVPACGITRPNINPRWTGENRDSIHDLPWHASLYYQKDPKDATKKSFKCGATIVRNDFVITHVGCLLDEDSNAWITFERIYVITGNTYNDYDSPLHDPLTVKKSTIKDIYMNGTAFVSNAYFAQSTIALLRLENPFYYSEVLLPPCLSRKELKDSHYEASGRMAGFVETTTGRYSQQTVTTFDGSLDRCIRPDPTLRPRKFNLEKKFCPDNSNGLVIPGSGIVFKENDFWYLRAIVTEDFFRYISSPEIGNQTSNKFFPVIDIAPVMSWIYKLIADLDAGGTGGGTSWVAQWRTPFRANLRNTQPSASRGSGVSCLVPRQPSGASVYSTNGEWKFHGYGCTEVEGCTVPQNISVSPGSVLTYKCSWGWKIDGNSEVHCKFDGTWSSIPSCVKAICPSLNTASLTVSCSDNGKWSACDNAFAKRLVAEVSCRPGYRKDGIFADNKKELLTCTGRGLWYPDPPRCIPVCGVQRSKYVPINILRTGSAGGIGGTTANITNFRWHASLYIRTSVNGTKNILCGGTIIQANFILTAAHCVFEEQTKTARDPRNLFVMTGNIFRDYDSSLHDPAIVRTSTVKKVYVHDRYFGEEGNYVSDIALLELEKPFRFTETFLPACWHVSDVSGQLLEPGSLGRMAGFGRTATARTSSILQTITAPYIPFEQCKSLSNAKGYEQLISNDKFCAGYTNGTAVCDGDSGGGFVFEKNGQWFVLGIISVGLGVDLSTGERTCDRNSYTLYTKVSDYLDWIENTISSSDRQNL